MFFFWMEIISPGLYRIKVSNSLMKSCQSDNNNNYTNINNNNNSGNNNNEDVSTFSRCGATLFFLFIPVARQ